MKKILSTLLALLLTLTIFFASGTNVMAADGTEKLADELHVAYEIEHTTLNPHRSNNAAANYFYYQMYSLLWKTDAEGNLVNDLVDEWSVTDDMLNWNITIKSGLKWSDGSDLTIDDVIATLDHCRLDHESPVGEEFWFITSLEKTSDYSMIIHCDEPYPAARNILACNDGVILSKKVLDNYSNDEIGLNPETWISSGPYKMTEWVQNDHITMERNEYYYGEPAKTPKIVFYPITEASAREVALETGEVDIAYMMQAEQVKILETMPDDFKIYRANGAFSRVFRFGCNDEHFSKKEIRLACMYALDAKAICDALFPGLYNECTSATIPGAFGYVNLGVHVQDLEKAKALLAEAGYPDGFKTEIHTTPRYAKGVEIAEAIADQLKAIGIEAKVVNHEWAEMLTHWSGQTAETFDQPIFIMGAGCDTLDCDTAFNRLYTTTQDGTNTGTNYGFYSNAEVDELVRAAAVSTDSDFRLQCYHRVCEILWQEDPAQLYIYDPVTAYGLAANVEGFWCNPIGDIRLYDAYKVIG